MTNPAGEGKGLNSCEGIDGAEEGQGRARWQVQCACPKKIVIPMAATRPADAPLAVLENDVPKRMLLYIREQRVECREIAMDVANDHRVRPHPPNRSIRTRGESLHLG